MAKTVRLTESELKNMIIESVKKILKEARTSNETKTIVLSIGDFYYENKELDEWIGDNWDNLPTEDVEITINFRYIPEDKGDYWTPPSGGYIELNDIEFNDNPLMQYLKQELSTEFVQTIMATIESYVEENVDELVQYQEEDGPDPDAWREDYLLRKYGY